MLCEFPRRVPNGVRKKFSGMFAVSLLAICTAFADDRKGPQDTRNEVLGEFPELVSFDFKFRNSFPGGKTSEFPGTSDEKGERVEELFLAYGYGPRPLSSLYFGELHSLHP